METTNQANTQTNQATAPAVAPEQGKWGKRAKAAAKVIGVGIGAAALGALGFIGAKYYTEHHGS